MLEESQRLHANLRNEQIIAQQRLNSIRDSVAGLQVDSDSLNAAQIKLRALQREADATREVFEAFLSRYKETAQLDNAQAQSRILSRSEEHTSELQSLMRISYAVFCLKKKRKHKTSKTIIL